MSKRAQSPSSHIGCFILHKVCGKYAAPMQHEFEGFVSTNGLEWTCSRFKAIWNAALHLKNGDIESARKVYQENSISYHPSTMLPKGAWGFAVRQFVQAQRPSVVRRWSSVLRIYTSITLDKPSPNQVAKFHSAVECNKPERFELLAVDGAKLARTVCRERGVRITVSEDEVLKQAPSFAWRLHGTSYYFTGLDLAKVRRSLKNSEHEVQTPKGRRRVNDFDDLIRQPYGKMLLSLLTESWAPPSLRGMVPYDDNRYVTWSHGLDSGYNGRVMCLQQQGCKGRTVFQPTAELQYYFNPLAEVLEQITKALYPKEANWVDQVDGVYQAIALLEQGHDVFSIDQSSATDRFPRTFSEGILKELGLVSYARALEEVCHRPWKAFDGTDVTVSVGQPMGLCGSFQLYNLSHLMVADQAVMKARAKVKDLVSFPDGTYFKIVGDDIIISDVNVSTSYRSILKELGCLVSESKSFAGQLAEFSGFVAYLDLQGNAHAFRPYKYPIGDEITNPVDFLHAIGVRARDMSPKWAQHYRAYQDTINQRYLDLSPYGYLTHIQKEREKHLQSVDKSSKQSSIVGAANALMDSLCTAYDNGCRDRQLVRTINSYPHLHGTSYLFGDKELPVVMRRFCDCTAASTVQGTGSKDRLSVPYVRADYKALDDSIRLEGHHIAHKRLSDDPLIREREYELSSLSLDNSSIEDSLLSEDNLEETDDLELGL